MESAFDRWLTRDPHYHGNGLTEVERENWTETDKESGTTYPILIDELTCSCGKHIGWSSDGTFTAFWTDDNESVYLCEDCVAEVEDNRYTE